MAEDTRDRPLHPRHLLAVLRRRLWILLPCVVIGTGVAFLISHVQEKKYSSTAALLFQQDALSQQLFGFATSTVIDPTTVAATNLNLVSQPIVATNTAHALAISQSRVTSEVSVAAAGASNVVDVTATDRSPTFAARLANTYAQQFVVYRKLADQSQVVEAAAQLQGQINRLRAAQPAASQLPNLETRLSQLDVVAAIQTGNVQQAQQALVPSGPSAPRTERATILGLMAGLLIGLAAVFLAERFDQTMRDPDDVRDVVGLPLLGMIPSSRELSGSSKAKPFGFSAEDERFRLLRAQLRYFNVDRAIESVLVSSAAPGDGKSTVAWHLARAEATLSPDSTVLLVDADLRRPRLAEMAGLPQAPGLAELLTQDLALNDVVRQCDVEALWGERVAKLWVLTAGGGAPNPSELMESNKLRHLVSELHAKYDFIVFDAPPPAIVSDVIPLVTQVSGVLVVVRLRHTRRDALRRLVEQLGGLGAHALGLVLNDLPTSEFGYGGYGGYPAYSQERESSSNGQPTDLVAPK